MYLLADEKEVQKMGSKTKDEKSKGTKNVEDRVE
jgi:hypothetical protein